MVRRESKFGKKRVIEGKKKQGKKVDRDMKYVNTLLTSDLQWFLVSLVKSSLSQFCLFLCLPDVLSSLRSFDYRAPCPLIFLRRHAWANTLCSFPCLHFLRLLFESTIPRSPQLFWQILRRDLLFMCSSLLVQKLMMCSWAHRILGKIFISILCKLAGVHFTAYV